MNEPDAFIAERLAMQAENASLLVKLNDALARNARLFKEAYDEIATARADALEEAAREMEILASHFRVENGKGAYEHAAMHIRAMNAAPRATDGPTGAPAEKTTQGSPDQTSGCSTTPSASVEEYRDPRTGMTDRERKLFPTSYREF
jgi:hypothetical protein